MAGGGVCGKGAGIDHGTMTQVGLTIEVFHLFIVGFHRVGEMTTETIVGTDVSGITSQFPRNKFNGTGAPGKEPGIGRSKIPGVSRVCSPKHNQFNHLEWSNQNLRQNRKFERSLNRNTERTNNRSIYRNNKETRKKQRVVKRIKSRMTIRVSDHKKRQKTSGLESRSSSTARYEGQMCKDPEPVGLAYVFS